MAVIASRPQIVPAMKKLFYLGVILLIAFELANVWFIMPLPYSQRSRSIDLAYFLYTWRWWIRALAGLLIVAGALPAWRVRGWRLAAPVVTTALAALVTWFANAKMAADRIFLPPDTVAMATPDRNAVDSARLVIGVAQRGEARAYPLQLIGYHHQVQDSVAGVPVLVTYCTVCRSGRVFSPVIDGKPETFRLVGMDHFNAMLEDASTRSWWRQATGQAVAGPRKGQQLRELPSHQATLGQWLALHPGSLVMQPDPRFADRYPKDLAYESGESRRPLTGTDTGSWRDKSWVLGIDVNGESKAYDWNRLRTERVINDVVGGWPIVVAIAPDGVNYFAYRRPEAAAQFTLRGDSLVTPAAAYALSGRGTSGALVPVVAYQEFWHSWRTFHPDTKRY